MRSRSFDLQRLRNIPILTMAAALGLSLKRTGGGIWNVQDADDPLGHTSLTIWEKKNCWKRWSGKTSGGVCQGSTIDLVMHIRDCDFKEAIAFLSQRFL